MKKVPIQRLLAECINLVMALLFVIPLGVLAEQLCALLAAFLVLLIRRCIIRHRRKKSFYVESTNQAVLNLWQYAQRLALWGAEPTQAQQDLALKAKFSQHTITPEELGPYRQEILHTAALTRLTLSRWKKFRFTWLSCLDWKEK